MTEESEWERVYDMVSSVRYIKETMLMITKSISAELHGVGIIMDLQQTINDKRLFLLDDDNEETPAIDKYTQVDSVKISGTFTKKFILKTVSERIDLDAAINKRRLFVSFLKKTQAALKKEEENSQLKHEQRPNHYLNYSEKSNSAFNSSVNPHPQTDIDDAAAAAARNDEIAKNAATQAIRNDWLANINEHGYRDMGGGRLKIKSRKPKRRNPRSNRRKTLNKSKK